VADVTYIVRTKYETEGLQQSGSLAERAGASFDRLGGAIKLAATAAVAFAAGKLVSAITEIGSKAEQTRIALAGIAQASGAPLTKGAEGFSNALAVSDEIIARMRKDARELPGEFEDLVTIFRGGLGGGIRAGQSIAEIEKVSAKLTAVAATVQVPFDQASRELRELLEGRAGAHNTLFLRLRDQIGKTAQEFNQLSSAKQWTLISKALDQYEPAVNAFGSSWEAVSSTAQDYLKQTLQAFGTPLFNEFKAGLQELTGLFEENQGGIVAMAKSIGEGIGGGLRLVLGLARQLGRSFKELSIGGIAGALAGGGGTAGAIGLAGAAAGFPAAGLLGVTFAQLATDAGALSSVTGSLSELWASFSAALMPAYEMFSQVTGVLGGLLAEILPGSLAGLQAAITPIIDQFFSAHDAIGTTIVIIGNQLRPLMVAVGRILAALGGIFGDLGRIVIGLAKWILTLIAQAIQPMTWYWGQLGKAIAWIIELIGKAVHFIADKLLLRVERGPGIETTIGNAVQGATEEGLTGVGGAGRGGGPSPAQFGKSLDEKVIAAIAINATPKAAKAELKQTNNITVHQTVNQAEAPQQLLIATRKALQQALEHPVEDPSSLGSVLR